jgi:NTF2 fold immunity protein
MRNLSVGFCAFLFAALALGQGYRPPSGYVPDSATAVKIGEAVLIPIYGKKQIQSELPLSAHLKDHVWTVTGTLRCPDGKGGTTTQCSGGVAVVEISKVDGRILSMTHYK